jgi:hypothetical protein
LLSFQVFKFLTNVTPQALLKECADYHHRNEFGRRVFQYSEEKVMRMNLKTDSDCDEDNEIMKEEEYCYLLDVNECKEMDEYRDFPTEQEPVDLQDGEKANPVTPTERTGSCCSAVEVKTEEQKEEIKGMMKSSLKSLRKEIKELNYYSSPEFVRQREERQSLQQQAHQNFLWGTSSALFTSSPNTLRSSCTVPLLDLTKSSNNSNNNPKRRKITKISQLFHSYCDDDDDDEDEEYHKKDLNDSSPDRKKKGKTLNKMQETTTKTTVSVSCVERLDLRARCENGENKHSNSQ